MTCAQQLGTLGLEDSLLEATLSQENHDRVQMLWNIGSTERYFSYGGAA
jgi:hypothetical protein